MPKNANRIQSWDGYFEAERAVLFIFIQGHNFTSEKGKDIQGIQYVENLLNMDLFDSDLDALESGIILEIDTKPKHLIAGHRAGQGLVMRENPKDRGGIRYFSDSQIQLKLYDAGRNILHKQGMTMKGNY